MAGGLQSITDHGVRQEGREVFFVRTEGVSRGGHLLYGELGAGGFLMRCTDA